MAPASDIGAGIGLSVRSERKARRMTQARLAAKSGLARETIYRLEAGRLPTACALSRICSALGIDLARFDLQRAETDTFARHPPLTLLRDRRRSLDLTLEQCARAAGVSPATLSRFERGAERSRTLATFDEAGWPVRLISDGLAVALGFGCSDELDRYWRTGRLPGSF